jgi:hypothetical protein
VSWSAVEPNETTPDNFNWAGVDASLNSLTASGLGPVVYISGNPTWAANTDCGPILASKMGAFATFMGALAARYPQAKYWALYNEEDNADFTAHGYSSGGCFGEADIDGNGNPDYADYAVMLATAWTAVHQGNPKAQLAAGAIAFDNFNGNPWPPNFNCIDNVHPGHFNYNFLPNLLKYIKAHPLTGGRKYMDMLLFNYYDIYAGCWEPRAPGKGIQAKAAAIQQLMFTNARTTWPLLTSEFGENSLDLGEDGQSRCLTATIVRGSAAGRIRVSGKPIDLRAMVWWTFQDFPSTNPDPSKYWKYGIVDENATPKRSYYAYQTLTQELQGYKYVQTLSNTRGLKDIEAYKFTKGSLTKVVLWSSIPSETPDTKPPCSWGRQPRTATFGPRVTHLRIADMYAANLGLGQVTIVNDGDPSDLDARRGYIAINVAEVPQYVQVNP